MPVPFFRFYLPAHGRWLQPDPIGQAGGRNVYTYCGNDPVNGADAAGLSPEVGQPAQSNGNNVPFSDDNPFADPTPLSITTGVEKGWSADHPYDGPMASGPDNPPADASSGNDVSSGNPGAEPRQGGGNLGPSQPPSGGTPSNNNPTPGTSLLQQVPLSVLTVTTSTGKHIVYTTVKNSYQASILNVPKGTHVPIFVPRALTNPQAYIDAWRSASPRDYITFAGFWELPENNFKRGPRNAIYDAIGNYLYGATGAANGFNRLYSS